MLPKVYRKTKPSGGKKNFPFEANHGGGKVEGVIIGPESSVGTVATRPEVDQGDDKGIKSS